MASKRDFSRALNKLQLIARNSDWFIALFVLVGIGQSIYLGIVFFDSHFKTTLLHIWEHKQPRCIFTFSFSRRPCLGYLEYGCIKIRARSWCKEDFSSNK